MDNSEKKKYRVLDFSWRSFIIWNHSEKCHNSAHLITVSTIWCQIKSCHFFFDNVVNRYISFPVGGTQLCFKHLSRSEPSKNVIQMGFIFGWHKWGYRTLFPLLNETSFVLFFFNHMWSQHRKELGSLFTSLTVTHWALSSPLISDSDILFGLCTW